MESGTTFTALDLEPGDRFQRLRNDLGVECFGLNLLRLEPGQRGRIHRHEHQEEVYLVLEGTLSLLVEGQESTHERGELVRVAPSVRRQLLNRGPGALHLLAIGGAGEHHGRDGAAYAAWEDTQSVSPQEVPVPEDLPAPGRGS